MPRQTLKQRPDGRYACKYKGKFFYGSTQSEALAAREAYKRNEKTGLVEKPVTLIEYAAQWLPVHRLSLLHPQQTTISTDRRKKKKQQWLNIQQQKKRICLP